MTIPSLSELITGMFMVPTVEQFEKPSQLGNRMLVQILIVLIGLDPLRGYDRRNRFRRFVTVSMLVVARR
jgi:hypothetical protein